MLLLLLLMIVFCLTVAPDDDITDEPSEERCDESSGARTVNHPAYSGTACADPSNIRSLSLTERPVFQLESFDNTVLHL